MLSHAGRRTAITWWAEAGYDERDVMLWVGHEDPALTLRLYRQARNLAVTGRSSRDPEPARPPRGCVSVLRSDERVAV